MTDSTKIEQLVAAHLAGESPEIPESRRNEFDQALAAHAALQQLIEQTVPYADDESDERCAPKLPDEYRIEREIGKGGMGVVYLAHQQSLNRVVALKVLRPGEQTFGPLVKRFLGEAKHLARLRHPNIVSVHEIGDAHGEPYFTMDYIDGEPLSAAIRRGPMSPTQALAILKQVAEGVQHAHRQGIIHRDLKPSNVLIDHEGTAFVTDFGLARDVSRSSELTQTGEVLGTPQYMAPEQARGQSSLIGEATDIHALGLLLFEMLTGRAAFASSSPADVLVRLLHEDPAPLRSIDRRIPRDLETICQKMLRKSPAARYSSVSALLEDVRRFEAGEPLVARRTSLVRRTARSMVRHWKIAASVVLTAVLAVAIAAPLLDKSFDKLVAWGDEEIANGHPEVAAQFYRRALKDASESEKQLIVGRIVQTCRAMSDGEAAVELAMQIIDIAPNESFGPHDYLVAKALVAREHGNADLGTVNVWNSKPKPVLTLVQARLECALKRKLPEEQKLDAEQILTNVKLAIADGAYPVRFHPDYLYQLPQGGVEELQEILRNESTDRWTRARAGIALGKLHEENGDTDAAITAYRQAYELARSVYPMYAGVKVARGSKSRIDAPDAEECLLVHELVDTLHRLDPQQMPLPTGRVEFDVVGLEMPPHVHVELELKLSDPSISNPNQGLPHNLPRLVPLRQDRPSAVTVLDGTYRLHKAYSLHKGWDAEVDTKGRLLQVDIPKWPDQIEVRGGVVKLDPITLRMAQEIELLSPANGKAIDLSNAELRWKAVPNADVYRIQLSVRKEMPRPVGAMFLTLDVKTPQLRFIDIEKRYHHLVRENLIAGSIGEWQVDAYDAEGKCTGVALQARRFLVAEPFPDL